MEKKAKYMDGRLRMRFDELMSKSSRLYYVFFALLGIGAVAGSLFYVNHIIGEGDIKQYMDSCIAWAGEGADLKALAASAVKRNMHMMLIMLIGSLFKPGIILIGAQIIRRGFVMGFTSCAVLKAYGFKSLYAITAMIPQNILSVPALILLAAVLSCSAAARGEERDKKFYAFYIIFLILIFSIFCAAALAEGYLTTTFMGKAVN